MAKNAIVINNVSKTYHIGKRHSDTLRDKIASSLSFTSKKYSEFNALDNFSAEIKVGDVCGLIGKNGAGKSTLLKLISRITYPSTGSIELNGKVASLLEVGTGFHPELTGRENVILNGSILGMSRRDIENRFDEIVAFSGVEKFIDTPVKHYSSGMYVRLAFSVAAHLEPEILIVDEVLAVGDAEFQKKCLGRMKDVSNEGRTVVFVSHNIAAIKGLCTSGIVLKKGRKTFEGNIDEAVSFYVSDSVQNNNELFWKPTCAVDGDGVSLLGIEIDSSRDQLLIGQGFKIHFDFKLIERDSLPNLTFQLSKLDGDILFVSSSYYQERIFEDVHLNDVSASKVRYTCNIPEYFLNEGRFLISKVLLFYGESRVVFEKHDVFSFKVEFDPEAGFGLFGRNKGPLRPMLDWQIKRLQ